MSYILSYFFTRILCSVQNQNPCERKIAIASLEWLFSSLRPLRVDEISCENTWGKVYHGFVWNIIKDFWLCWLHVSSSFSSSYFICPFPRTCNITYEKALAFCSHFSPKKKLFLCIGLRVLKAPPLVPCFLPSFCRQSVVKLVNKWNNLHHHHSLTRRWRRFIKEFN